MGNCYTFTKLSGLLLCACALLSGPAAASDPDVDTGRKLAQEFCQACHFFAGTNQAGTVAPPLAGMTGRFPDRSRLFQIINDPIEPLGRDTMMPPFGRNGLMSEKQINTLIDYLYTL